MVLTVAVEARGMHYQHWAILWLPNLLLLVDWAKHRRDVAWFFVLAGFGPLGALAYTWYFWDSIDFPFRLASLKHGLPQKTVLKRCPRCLQEQAELLWVEEGRGKHAMCGRCAAEVTAART